MAVNTNSKSAFGGYSWSPKRKTDAYLIIETMNKHNRPMYMQEVSKLSGIPERNMGQVLGKDLQNAKLVYRLKEKGRNANGRKVDLFVTREYLMGRADCPRAIDDPREIKITQTELF